MHIKAQLICFSWLAMVDRSASRAAPLARFAPRARSWPDRRRTVIQSGPPACVLAMAQRNPRTRTGPPQSSIRNGSSPLHIIVHGLWWAMQIMQSRLLWPYARTRQRREGSQSSSIKSQRAWEELHSARKLKDTIPSFLLLFFLPEQLSSSLPVGTAVLSVC
jgi:hypothetical protein